MIEKSASDPLKLVIHSTEEQLDDRVETVSDAKPAREESTSELIALEETLSSAQQKAKQLVTLRRKIEAEEEAAASLGTAAAAREEQPQERPATEPAPAP